MANVDLYAGNGVWNPQFPSPDPGTWNQTPQPMPASSQPHASWGGWNSGNVFDSWDLNPLSQQTGVARDQLATERDAFLQPLFSQFRQFGKAPEDDPSLFSSADFRRFAQTGARPQIPNQFDDPYTNQLESIAKSQMGELRNNPGLNQLTGFLNQQFKDLSTSPGFSPAEMAVLNTQAFEPIEEMRRASSDQALQRTANRGMLPTSGLAGLDQRNVDQFYDKLRTQANRDLAINAIDRRDSDLNRAGSIASQLGLTIPQGQRSEEVILSNLL